MLKACQAVIAAKYVFCLFVYLIIYLLFIISINITISNSDNVSKSCFIFF